MLVGKCYAANLFLISPVMSFTMTELRDGLVAERMSGYGIASTSGNYCIYWFASHLFSYWRWLVSGIFACNI